MEEFFAFIAQALGGSFSGDKIRDQLEKRGISDFNNWVLASLGGAGVVLLATKVMNYWNSEPGIDPNRPLEYLLPGSMENKVDHYWMKDPDWGRFSSANSFQQWFNKLSKNDQKHLITFWAEWAFYSGQNLEDLVRQANL